ncbi:MAG: transketolase family protein [Sphaerochaetaceae bacterium]
MSEIFSARDGYGVALKELGAEREDIVVLDADLSCATMTSGFATEFPDRFYNMGISEQDMVGTAAGLAMTGKVPFASTFALFLAGRAYDQVRNAVAYPKLNVKLVASHCGLMVGRDGASHQSFEDISLMRSVPNMMVISPGDYFSTQVLIKQIAEYDGPVFCRVSRLKTVPVYTREEAKGLVLGKANVFRKGSRVALFTHGILLKECMEALPVLKNLGITPTIVDVHTIKPLDQETIVKVAESHDILISIEDHSVLGGLGTAIAEALCKEGIGKKLKKLGMQDTFGESGDEALLLRKYGMDALAIIDCVKESL